MSTQCDQRAKGSQNPYCWNTEGMALISNRLSKVPPFDYSFLKTKTTMI